MSYRFIPPEGRDSQTLHQVLAHRVANRGEARWIVGEERSWTYRDIDTKDAIRRRGENISSMEVEQEIVAHPDIVECAVIPVASEHTEQEVMAVVVPRPGAVIDPAEFIEFLAPRMAYFMVPRYVEVVGALPRTQTGKIRKYALRERGITPGTWDREAAGIRLRR